MDRFSTQTTNTEEDEQMKKSVCFLYAISQNVLPRRADVTSTVFKLGFFDKSNPLELASKLMLMPFYLDEKTKRILEKFNRFSPLMLINHYKFSVIHTICCRLGKPCNITFKVVELSLKLVNDISDPFVLYRFLNILKSPPTLNDVHILIDEYRTNVIIYNAQETLFYPGAHVEGHVIVFKYNTLESVDFIDIFDSLNAFNPQIASIFFGQCM